MAAMEASRPLTIESFSYSWLTNMKPCLELLDESSFIEMDPRLPPSKRIYQKLISRDFKFDSPVNPSHLTLIHADELFSDGYVLPIFPKPAKTKSCEDKFHSGKSLSSSSPRRRGRLSKQLFHKCFQLVRPICQVIRRCKSSSKRESSWTHPSKNFVYPAYYSSPRISSAYSVDNWRRSCDSDSLIYEAVLHCNSSRER